jgi:hypothetical protein
MKGGQGYFFAEGEEGFKKAFDSRTGSKTAFQIGENRNISVPKANFRRVARWLVHCVFFPIAQVREELELFR